MEKTVAVFQLTLCECPDIPWASELSFCSTEPACVNGVGPAAVCNVSTKHTLPASPEERSGKITVVVWVKQEVEFDAQM